MTVWIQDLGEAWFGHTYAISAECHDGIVYVADNMAEAIAKYEYDNYCTVDEIKEVE